MTSIALTIGTLVGKVMSLLFNMLSRLVVAFLPSSNHLLNFVAAVTICSDFGVQGNKFCHCVHCFPIYLPRSDGTECHDLCLWNIEFSASFFILLFFLYQEAFHTSSVSAIRVVSFANLRLFIFLPESLIPASSSTAFCMMYSAYKLNKQGDNIQP